MRLKGAIPVLVLAALCVAMSFIPPAANLAHDAGSFVRARVIETDNSQLTLTGLVEYGTQHLRVEMLEGPAKGKAFAAANELRAQLDVDKKFSVGDTITGTWPVGGACEGDVLVARDHWRLGWS